MRGAHRNELVRGLDAVRTASGGVDVALPAELVQKYVDAGRSPDEFTVARHGAVERSSAAVRAKQHGFQRLEEAIRHQLGPGGLLPPDGVKAEK